MEDNFYKDEFERFLQEQANNHRMFASDSVWRNIYNKLHGDKTWPALTFAAFAFLAAIIAVSVYFSPGPNIFASKTAPAEKVAIGKTTAPLLNSLSNNFSDTRAQWNYNDKSPVIKEDQVADKPVALVSKSSAPVIINKNSIEYSASSKIVLPPSTDMASLSISELNKNLTIDKPLLINKTEETERTATIKTDPSKVIYSEKETEKAIVDQYLKEHPTDIAALNAPSNKLKNRFSYLVYIAPSMSFRRLSEESFTKQDAANAGGPLALNYVADVNKIVRHVPGTGIEAGVAFGYNITKNLKITSGLQFNIRQYLIEAYMSGKETTTIALQTSYGVDSVSRSSVYSTSNGYSSTQLANRYYQVSIPVGFEWRIIGSKKVALNVAASVQPTYTLNKSAYLISTNFKNYAESGGMLRNWNINTSIGAFLNFNSGKYKWQLGPQFRYQQLPTFTSQYPIKEHLMDCGIKIGVSKSIQ